jgi:hypothetical protein
VQLGTLLWYGPGLAHEHRAAGLQHAQTPERQTNTDARTPETLLRGAFAHWRCKGDDTMTRDFKTTVYRIKMLGFNSMRLAFTFGRLNQQIECVPMACARSRGGSLHVS